MKNNLSEISKKLFIPILELMKIKKFDEALTLLEKISDQDPDIINKLKGSIYLNKKEWEKSLFYYQKISDLSKNFKIFNNIGVSLFKLGKLNDAINQFNQSIHFNNSFLSAYENLSIAHMQLGNYDLSIKFTLKALNLSPNNNKMKNRLIEIFNFYKPKLNENSIIKLNDQICKLDTLNNKETISQTSICKILENSEEIFQKSNVNLLYAETQIYRRNKINLNCDRHFGIFNKFKIIPKYCFSCYKIQINVSNVSELIKLYFYFNNLNLKENNIRKCMVELRENVLGNYKGYLYASSITEAKNLEKEIKNDLINYKIRFKKIEIKHGCTEYYDEYNIFKNIKEDITKKIYKKEWENIEKEYDRKNLIKEGNSEKVYDNTLNKFNLSDFLIIKNWILYAGIINDFSYKEIFKYDVNSDYLSEMDIRKIKMRTKHLMN